MRSLLLAMLLAASAAATLAQDTARMGQLVASHESDDRFMGSVLVARAGTVIFEKSSGYAVAEWEIPNAADTKFLIGSVTKQFTAALILLLEERGKLSLSDPVARHWPDAPSSWKDVTLFHLLTHTAGLPNVTNQPDYMTWKRLPAPVEKTVDRFRNLPLEFPPGEKMAYSNSGYILLGYLIERITGERYEDFISENIFKPLHMQDTGYGSNARIISRLATGYVSTPKGLARASHIDLSVPHAAGALYSTTHDLMRWNDALFGGQLLAPASLEKMTTPYKNDYGLGLAIKTSKGRKQIGHGGGIDGFTCQLNYYPETKTTVVTLANTMGPAAGELANQLAATAFNESVTLTAERKAIMLAPETLRRYVGVYQLAPKITTTIRLVDGQLTAQLTGQQSHPLFAESESDFFLKVVDAQMRFFRDDQGRVTHMILHQGGRETMAARISDTVSERIAIELPRTVKERYVGVYELSPGFDLAITLEGDQLMSQATGQGKVPVFPETERKFFLKIVDAQIEFQVSPAGEATHLILHQGGREVKGRRK